MKKLMIAAAIVCAAAFVHAANVKWVVTGIDPDSGVAGDCYAYGFISSAGGTDTSVFTADALVAMIKNGVDPYDDITGAYGDDATGYPTDGGSANFISSAGIDVTGASAESPKTIHAMMLILDTDDLKTAENYQIVDLGDVKFKSTTPTVQVNAVAGNDWKPIKEEPVPEPFSGVLALVGMGAIALRRKMKKAKRA